MPKSLVRVRWYNCSELVAFNYDVHIRVYNGDFTAFSKAINEVLESIAKKYNARIPDKEKKSLSPDNLKDMINTRIGEVTSVTLNLVEKRSNRQIGELRIHPGGHGELLFVTGVEGWIHRDCKN